MPKERNGTNRRIGSSSRRSRSLTLLPTLEEAMALSSDDESIVELGNEESLSEHDNKENNTDQSEPEIEVRNIELVACLKTTAARLAQRGDEVGALKAYKRALAQTHADVTRIKLRLKRLSKEKTNTTKTLHLHLHSDWLEVGFLLAEIRTLMAIVYERVGDYEGAIACCKEAKEVHRRQELFKKKIDGNENQPYPMLEKITHMMTRMESARDSFQERKRLHQEVIKLRRKIAATEDQNVKSEMYNQAFALSAAVFDLESESLGKTHPQLADTLSLLSSMYVELGDMEKGLKMAHRALDITEVALGALHPRYGKKCFELATIYLDLSKEQEAIVFHQKTVRVFRELGGRHLRLVGSSLNNIAGIFIRRGDFSAAITILSDALISYESADDKGAEVFVDTVDVWKNLGECYSRRNEWDSAIVAYLGALDVQRNTRRVYDAANAGLDDRNTHISAPPAIVSEESIADTLSHLAKAYASLKEHDHASACLEEALLIHRNAVNTATEIAGIEIADDRSHKELLVKKQQLAQTGYSTAEVLEACGRLDEAMALYTESLQLRSISDEPTKNLIQCAMSLAGIGSIHMKRAAYQDACRVLKKAISHCITYGLPSEHRIVLLLTRRLEVAMDGLPKYQGETRSHVQKDGEKKDCSSPYNKAEETWL